MTIVNTSEDLIYNDGVTIPNDFFGIHFNTFPLLPRNTVNPIDGVSERYSKPPTMAFRSTYGVTTKIITRDTQYWHYLNNFIKMFGTGKSSSGVTFYNAIDNSTIIGELDYVIDENTLALKTAVNLIPTNSNYPTIAINYISKAPSVDYNYSMIRSFFMGWNENQPTQNGAVDFTHTDSRLKYHLNITPNYWNKETPMLIILEDVPNWACTSPNAWWGLTYNRSRTAPVLQYWVTYLTAMANHYSSAPFTGKVLHFEIWNEPAYLTYRAKGIAGSTTLDIVSNWLNIIDGGIVHGDGIVAGSIVVSSKNDRSFSVYPYIIQTITLNNALTADVDGTVYFDSGSSSVGACSATVGTNTITSASPITGISLPIAPHPASWRIFREEETILGVYSPFIRYTITNVVGNTITVAETITASFTNKNLVIYNNSWYFNDKIEILSVMTRLANQIIKSVIPTAKIISPAISGILNYYYNGNRGREVAAFLNTSAEGFVYNGISGVGTKMKDWIDVIGFHTYEASTDTPMHVKNIRKEIAKIGMPENTEMWSTEFGYGNPGNIANFVGSVSGNTLTVSAVNSGIIALGNTLRGATATFTATIAGNVMRVKQADNYEFSGKLNIGDTVSGYGITNGTTITGFITTTFTASISANNMVVSAISSGTILRGLRISGINVNTGAIITDGTTITGFIPTVFTGSISGNTIVVSTITAGTILSGMIINGINIATGVAIANGTTITGFVSGTNGGTGTYTISGSPQSFPVGTSIAANNSGGIGTYTISGSPQSFPAGTTISDNPSDGKYGSYNINNSHIIDTDTPLYIKNNVLYNTKITAYGTGIGNTGTYILDTSQNVSSCSMVSSYSEIQYQEYWIKWISRVILLSAFGGCAKTFYYQYDDFNFGTTDPVVITAVAANINFIKGKTLAKMVHTKKQGIRTGGFTAYFTDNTSITV